MPSPNRYLSLQTLLGIIVLLVVLLVVIDKLGVTNSASKYIQDFSSSLQPSGQEPHLFVNRGNVIEIIWTFLLSAVLGGIVAYKGQLSRYQFSVLQAHMILSVSAAMMMMIIGGELARAFGILGAAGIVRYRYRLMSPKEASSLIIALGVGLACGTGLYVLAVTASLTVVFILNLQSIVPSGVLRLFFGPRYTMQLKCTIVSDSKQLQQEHLENIFQEQLVDYNVTSMKYRSGERREHDIVFEVSIQNQKQKEDISQRLLELNVLSFTWKDLSGE